MKKNCSTTMDKVKIMTLWREGIAKKDIGVHTGFPVRSIQRVILANRNLPEWSIPIRKKGSGRPKKTSKSTDRLLKSTVLNNPMMTAKEIKEVMFLELGNVSVHTSQQPNDDCKGNQGGDVFGARKRFSSHNLAPSAEGPETTEQVCCH
jgi:hypothetical protein